MSRPDRNLFWTRSPGTEPALLARAPRPGRGAARDGPGGPQSAERVTAPLADTMRAHGYTDVRARTDTAGLTVCGRAPGQLITLTSAARAPRR